MTVPAVDLRAMRCEPRRGSPMTNEEAQRWLAAVPEWRLAGREIERTFEHASYAATIAFVNAVAQLAEAEDHHPDMLVGYRRCTVRFSTHRTGGLSLNDFVCAAKVDALVV
jgi:4a-hydroxytetrahydrobiopterin dehydratase